MIGLDLPPSACKRPLDLIADIFLPSAIQLASATAYMLALTVDLELATTQTIKAMHTRHLLLLVLLPACHAAAAEGLAR